MKTHLFKTLAPLIAGNPLLRIPQRDGYAKLKQRFEAPEFEREVGVVLPVGCGKSGLITLTPFGAKSRRSLVVAPGLRIAAQLYNDFLPQNPTMFYQACKVLSGSSFPEPAEIRGTKSNVMDLELADVVVTNIGQLQGSENRWLEQLPADFFDLILFDEGHHNVAESWKLLRRTFPEARIVNFSATPTRADGQLMEGKIVYSFPIFEAIQAGYVKRMKAVVLNPQTLRYVRGEDGQEVEVSLDEVRRLGEEEADFRRSIVSSKESLSTIVDCSIRELYKTRERTDDQRHKIIASALNYSHCVQIVEAYQARGLRAAYVHSKQAGAANQKIFDQLERHELDAIVQVRMLGEGFDHLYLSVAAVCSIFRNLAPFVQFVGRIMRVIDKDNKDSPLNEGTVVFHAGANIASRWEDFQRFSQADQEFFDQLLPLESVDFADASELTIEPSPPGSGSTNLLEIREQDRVLVEEIPLLEDEEVRQAIEVLQRKGVSAKDYADVLQRVPTTRLSRRQAARQALDEQVKIATGGILKRNRLKPAGRSLDRKKLGRDNFVVVKSEIDSRLNLLVGRKAKERAEFTQDELDKIEAAFEKVVEEVEQEMIHG